MSTTFYWYGRLTGPCLRQLLSTPYRASLQAHIAVMSALAWSTLLERISTGQENRIDLFGPSVVLVASHPSDVYGILRYCPFLPQQPASVSKVVTSSPGAFLPSATGQVHPLKAPARPSLPSPSLISLASCSSFLFFPLLPLLSLLHLFLLLPVCLSQVPTLTWPFALLLYPSLQQTSSTNSVVRGVFAEWYILTGPAKRYPLSPSFFIYPFRYRIHTIKLYNYKTQSPQCPHKTVVSDRKPTAHGQHLAQTFNTADVALPGDPVSLGRLKTWRKYGKLGLILVA